MKTRRLVVVARRFWPASNLSEITLSALVRELVKCGFQIDVLTPRWHRQWNNAYQMVGVDVTRLSKPTSRRWRTEPFSKGLKTWFVENSEKVDVILVWDGWKDGDLVEAIAGTNIPVICRMNTGLHAVNLEQQAFLDRINLISSKNASPNGKNFWVCDSNSFDRLTKPDIWKRENVILIDDALPFDQIGTKTRTDSRLALSDSHQMLAVGVDHPLGVFIGEIAVEFPFKRLIQAWIRVTEHFPGAMFWFVGQGRGCDHLWEMLLKYQMQHHMLIVGEFDSIEDVLVAANICVDFEFEGYSSSSVRLARALGLPVVTIPVKMIKDHPGNMPALEKELLFAIGENLVQDQYKVDNAKIEFARFVRQYEQFIIRAIES